MSLKFQIRGLHCAYGQGNEPVLLIEELDIPEREVLFFLGVSGVGKSTLIESLGLMSDTIVPKNGASLKYFHGEEEVDMLQLWNSGGKKMADFRANQYSFIFQSTNLFNDLPILDNVCLPALNQTALKPLEIEEKALKYLRQLLVNVSDDDFKTKMAGALSGGQKQRLAFVRALTSPHNVMFCDEPTGNLDAGNAHRLMGMLKSSIQEENSTALVVSHDIPLALDFADRIILMTKQDNPEGGSTGVVLSENQFVKQDNGGWKSKSQSMTRFAFNQFLVNHFNSN